MSGVEFETSNCSTTMDLFVENAVLPILPQAGNVLRQRGATHQTKILKARWLQWLPRKSHVFWCSGASSCWTEKYSPTGQPAASKAVFFRVTIRPRTLWVFAKSKNSYTMSANGSCVLVIWVWESLIHETYHSKEMCQIEVIHCKLYHFSLFHLPFWWMLGKRGPLGWLFWLSSRDAV